MQAKPPTESTVTMAVQMLPSDANPQGQVHGGTIMKLVDSAAAVAAHRHARSMVVTARIDEMSFLAPVEVGDLVTLRASVNAIWTTSMEVGVRVETENLLTGEVRHTASAFLVIVAIDDQRQPHAVPPLVPTTPEQERRLADAQIRRAHRIATRRPIAPTAAP
jgi:uncharacterized protein (TIGR00369 family)